MFIETQKSHLKELKERLRQLESGELKTGERNYGDTTEQEKTKLQKQIADVQAQLVQLESDDT